MNKINTSRTLLPNSYNIRIFLLMGLMTLIIAYMGYGLFNLQVVKHGYYLALAQAQHGQTTVIPANRGQIYLDPQKDAPPLLVGTNVLRNTVYAVGKFMSSADKKYTAKVLSPIISVAQVDLLNKLESGNQNYLPLARQLTDDQSKQISDLKLIGVNLEPETVRYYPQGTLASQVLGFLGYNGDTRAGQYGVEGKFNKELAGIDGVVGITNGGVGKQAAARDGDDVYLTLDPSIQFKAQQVLQDAVTSHQADSGSVVVMNPKTGAITAMTNFPDFDPNQYSKAATSAVYNNSSVSSDYEPGSVFKAITMAAGIGEGKVTPESTYDDTGELDFDNFKIKNSDGKAHGITTMTQVLDESLNTGAAFVEQQVGNQKYNEYLQKFGFGKTIGFDLGSEAKGDLKNLANTGPNNGVFFATASFGQGITVTPIQLMQAYSAFANGGNMVKPYIVDKVVHPDGSADQTGTTNLGQVLDPKTSATVAAMLVDVVENGHGKKAGVKGYYIAGKTGTAQVANVGKAGYDPDKNIGTFIGFGPVDNPAFLMLVRINNPKDVKFAETTAAPAFGEIASFILNYLQIPPSR